jgi:deoxyhypusine synthase
LIPGPHKYAIQITTAKEEDGGLSGATLSEAVSWGKLNAQSKTIDIRADATIVFPLIIAALKERRKRKD